MKKTAIGYVFCLMTVLITQSVLCFANDTENGCASVYEMIEFAEDLTLIRSEEPLFEGDLYEAQDYINFEKTGAGIVLRNDVKLKESFSLNPVGDTTLPIVIDGNVVLDLNGKFITQIAGHLFSENPLFIVPKGSSLTIRDSSQGKSGRINAVQNAIWVKGGTVTFDGGCLMAQSGAAVDYDEFELVVNVTDNGAFTINGGTIGYNGELIDGRTYSKISGAIYSEDGCDILINNGKVLGPILCENCSDISIYGGTFADSVEVYISKEYECVINENMYTVQRKVPEASAYYNGDEFNVTLNAVYDENEDRIEKYIVNAQSVTLYRKNTQVNITDILSIVSEFDTYRIPEIEIQTDSVTVVLYKETVRSLAESFSDKVYFVSDSGEELTDENKKLLKSARRQLSYAFVDGEGKNVDVANGFDVRISYIPEKLGNSINVYEVNNSKLFGRKFDYFENIIKYSASKGENILISDGYGLEIIGRALDLQGTISMTYYALPENLDIDNVKMLFWTSPQTEYTEKTAERIVKASGKNSIGYKFEYKNISSKDMNKEIYARLMAVNSDGEVLYSSIPYEGYSIRKYAQNMMKDEKLRPLLIKMLNYGTAAQEYFGSDEEAVNSILSDGERATDFTKLYKSEARTIEESGNYKKSNAAIIGKTLLLDGDISIKYYTTWQNETGYDDAGILFWTEDAFKMTQNHIYGTESYKTNYFVVSGKYRTYQYPNIVSSAMNKQVYARLYARYGNEYKYSDIDSYSVRDYVANQLAKNSDEALVKLLRTLMLYGEEAEKYFKVEAAD